MSNAIPWGTWYIQGDEQRFEVQDGAPALRNVRYRTAASSATEGGNKALGGTFGTLKAQVRLTPAARLAGNSLRSTLAGATLVDRLGRVLRDVDPATGSGIDCGPINYLDGTLALTAWPTGTPTLAVQAGLQQFGDDIVAQLAFRTPVAPLRPSSLTVIATDLAGSVISGSANAEGVINTPRMVGKVDYQTGVGRVVFRLPAGSEGEAFDVSDLGIPGITEVVPAPVYAETIRYSAVSYTYLPLDADIIGLDPVRLPSDGRVPILRRGDMVQIMHAQDTAPTVPTADGGGFVISCGRTRIGWVRVTDADGEPVEDGHTLDRDNGVVRFASLDDLALPLVVRHTVADLRMLTDVQITGRLALNRPLTHNYPADETVVASCLIHGDRRARVAASWDQQTWDGTWKDSISGSPATATLNLIDYPIEVTNEGCDTDRWVIRWTGANSVEVISEQRGLVWAGAWAPSGAALAPINPRTRGQDGQGGVPYFVIPGGANGGGWGVGQIVRLNTVGAIADLWIAQAIQQSEAPAGDGADGVELYTLGNVDRP